MKSAQAFCGLLGVTSTGDRLRREGNSSIRKHGRRSHFAALPLLFMKAKLGVC
jgi:hypothetical protein